MDGKIVHQVRLTDRLSPNRRAMRSLQRSGRKANLAGTRVRRQIPRTAGRRGEASRAFEGRLVEASGRIPQGVRDPPG